MIRLMSYIDRVVETMVIVIFAAMITVGTAQVFNRYFLNVSLSWSEEFQRYGQIWLVFLAVPIAYRRSSLNWLEDILTRQPYLAGGSLSTADIVAMPILQSLLRFGVKPAAIELALGFDDMVHSHPAILGWLGSIETIPGYDAAYPPHWRG